LIAADLGLSTHTVHSHVKFIYGVLGVHSRAEFRALVLPASDLPVYRDVGDALINSEAVDAEPRN
jgi:hypothetical protein